MLGQSEQATGYALQKPKLDPADAGIGPQGTGMTPEAVPAGWTGGLRALVVGRQEPSTALTASWAHLAHRFTTGEQGTLFVPGGQVTPFPVTVVGAAQTARARGRRALQPFHLGSTGVFYCPSPVTAEACPAPHGLSFKLEAARETGSLKSPLPASNGGAVG